MSVETPDKNELKSLLRGLLISTKKTMTANDLQRDFKSQEGHPIPHRQFGYSTLLDFLYSIPDTVKVDTSGGTRNPVIIPVLSEKTLHIDALVQKQKVNKCKRDFNHNAAIGRRAVRPSLERQAILIPYQLQERLLTMMSRYPEGVPFAKMEQEFCPAVLRNYGINCNICELIESLGHIVKVINRRVYLCEGTKYRLNNEIVQYNLIPNNRFVPPRLQSTLQQIPGSCDKRLCNNIDENSLYNNGSGDLSQEHTEDYTIQEDIVTSHNSVFEPPRYEAGENMYVSVKSGDLNIDKKYEQKEGSYEIGKEEHNETSNTLNLSTKDYSSHYRELANEDIAKYDAPSSIPHEFGSILVNNVMRNNFEALLDKNPDGIRCSELPHLYKEKYRVELDYRGLGFFSVLQMVSTLPDVFHCIREGAEDWKVLDARKPLPEIYKSFDVGTTTRVCKNTEPNVPSVIKNNIERLLTSNSCGLWSDFFLDKYQTMFGHSINFQELNFDSLESFLLFLNDDVLHMRYAMGRIMLYPHVEKQEPETDSPLPHISEPMDLFHELYPNEVVGPKDTIPHQELPPDVGRGSYLEVLVAEVYTPNNFWMQLLGEKTHMALDKLMNEIQIFYGQEVDYKMPEVTVRIDQYCMAPFHDELHRALIIAVPNLIEAQVCFVDYGTKSKVKRSDLRFMHKDFAILPIQAIKASLANLTPANGTTKWPRSVSNRFLELVSDKKLIAVVSTVDHESRELEVALVDTTGKEDIHINDTLKHEGLAEYKTSATTKVPSTAEPPIQQRIKVENVAPISRRPPPGFSSVPAPQAASSTLNMGTASVTQPQPLTGLGQSCFVPPVSNLPAYLTPAYVNPLAATINSMQLLNMQMQHTYFSSMFGNPAFSALMYGNPAIANPFGMPLINPPVMFQSNMMNKNADTELPSSTHNPAQAAEVSVHLQTDWQNVGGSFPSPVSESHTIDDTSDAISKMTVVDISNKSETEGKRMRKTSNSSTFVDSSEFEVVNTFLMESEDVDHGTESEDSEELFRSDDETDVTVENIREQEIQNIRNTEPLKPLYVKKVEMARKCVHIVNLQSVAYVCTDELVKLFTEFSGRHVILKILDSKGVVLPFREISRRESPELFTALEAENVVGLQRSYLADNTMAKVHLTPLVSIPQLLTVLYVKNREVFHAVQDEIDRFNSQDSYWTRVV